MASDITIRRATPADASAIGEIYDEGIASGIATFASGAHGPAERRAWLAARRETAPVFVGEVGSSGVEAWSGLAPYSHREWYSGVAEYTVYVRNAARAQGIGAEMLSHLIDTAPEYGYWKLVGMIIPENAAGMRLAERAGFRVVGTHLAHGRIDGRWRNVTLVERHLQGPGGQGASS